MSEKNRNFWIINGLLAVILALLVGLYLNVNQKAYAAGGGWETDGIMANSFSGGSERLIIMDTKKQNIMSYKILGSGQFRLVGARSYKYDVEIEDSAGTSVETGNGKTFSEIFNQYEASRPSKKP
ncbi:MAG: hypothetical protein V1899_06095 [Planctomycetota bacterium]